MLLEIYKAGGGVMFYFYLAYSILWIILIIYVFIIVNRQSNLEKELESLKMTLERLTK